jgi:hypothetical protein
MKQQEGGGGTSPHLYSIAGGGRGALPPPLEHRRRGGRGVPPPLGFEHISSPGEEGGVPPSPAPRIDPTKNEQTIRVPHLWIL